MAITLNIIKPTKAVEASTADGYLYKDVLLDLKLGFSKNNQLYNTNETKDLTPLYDAQAVINAVKNILTTSPGEKILNPTFGLDLRDYLFETVSETKGYFIGEDIVRGLPGQDNRIILNTVEVVVDRDEQQYEINLDIGIPSLNIPSITLNGILNNDGYTLV